MQEDLDLNFIPFVSTVSIHTPRSNQVIGSSAMKSSIMQIKNYRKALL